MAVGSVGFYHWVDFFIPISLIGAVNLRRDFQRHASFDSDFDCPIGPFFWGNAAKESEITAGRLELRRYGVRIFIRNCAGVLRGRAKRFWGFTPRKYIASKQITLLVRGGSDNTTGEASSGQSSNLA